MTLTDDDFTTARGFARNSDGRPMVTHPDNGKLVAYWGASEWPLDGPYTGDPIHGERGTLVHDLVYYTLGAIPADGLKARREEVGIPAEVARHIAEDWQRFAAEHAIVVDHVEHASVNDRYEIASPIDLVGTVDGVPAVIDLKTASDYRKVAYAVQLVYYAGSVKYTDGERGQWFDAQPPTLAAYIAHYPIGKALKARAAGDPLPRWELHPVDVEAARPWADMLHTLRRARPAVAFPGRAERRTDDSVVDPPADVVDIANEYTVIPAGFVDGVAFRPGDPMAADFAEGKGFDAPCDKIAVPDERTANVSTVEPPAGEAPPASPAQSLDNPKGYALDRFGRPVLPPADEGDDADPRAVVALKARYAALTGDAKAWVNATAKAAQQAGGALSLADSQPQSVRRFEAMRGLVLLAEAGFTDDDGVRGILRPILGDVADMAAFSVGRLVAALTPDEAARFARLADEVASDAVDVKWTDGPRCEWGFAA